MGIPLAVLGESMTADEFALHYADYLRNPWGPDRAEFDVGLVCSTVAGAAGARSTPRDFMPYRQRAEAESPESFFKAIT